MPEDIATILRNLAAKCGPDEESTVLIATLAAAWAETSARLTLAEERLSVTSGYAANALTRVALSMANLQLQVQVGDEKLAGLHREIADKISAARQLSTKADTAMQDVLKTYTDFSGNVNQLKKSVAGLASAALTAVAPGLGAVIDAPIRRVLAID